MATATPTDLTDAQWALLAPLLPPPNRRGRPRADDRRTINGILWVLRTGARWADLPRRYGAASTCHARLQWWERERVWDRVWRTLLSRLDEQGRLDWQRAHLDGTFIPAKKGGMPSALLAGARERSSWPWWRGRACPSACSSRPPSKRRFASRSLRWPPFACLSGRGARRHGRENWWPTRGTTARHSGSDCAAEAFAPVSPIDAGSFPGEGASRTSRDIGSDGTWR